MLSLNRLLMVRTNIPFNDNPIALQRGSVVKTITRTEKLQLVNNQREASNAKNPDKCRLGLPTNAKVTTLETSSITDGGIFE